MRILPFIAATVLFAGSAAAGDKAVVVELFTSQGCSSCPPADKFMEELAATPGVVALTLPVDIWDYLGWRDSFAKRQFSLRQQAYAPKMPSKEIYTPQMVIGGVSDVIGSHREDARELIKARADAPYEAADIALSLEGGTLTITLPPNPDIQGAKVTVWLARVLSRREVNVGDGENRGKVIAYSNVVRELIPLGSWDGQAATLTAEARSDIGENYDRLAVFVQEDDQGAILGAATIALD